MAAMRLRLSEGAVMGDFYLKRRTRYFTYLSTAKVSMLYGQIEGRARRRLAAKLKVRVPFVEAELGGTALAANDYDMLAVVLRHLHEQNDIGTVGAPNAYFAGEVQLRTNLWRSRFVFLGGRANDRMMVLGGSAQHLLGAQKDMPTVAIGGGSTVVGMADNLRNLFGVAFEEERELGERNQETLSQLCVDAALRQRGDPEKLEFVARTLVVGETVSSASRKLPPDLDVVRQWGQIPVVVGSPLYVAFSQ